MKGNTLQFYNKLTGGFVRLHPDGTVDAIGEKTDKYGKISGKNMWELEEGKFLDPVWCSVLLLIFQMALHQYLTI